METLAIIFSAIAILHSIIPYLPCPFMKVKESLNSHFLSSCQMLETLDDDGLSLAIKPFIFKISLCFMALASILLLLWGEGDNDAKELSIIWFGIALFWALALISDKEFSRILKVLFFGFITMFRWCFYLMIVILILGIALKILFGEPPTTLELQIVFASLLGPVAGQLILYVNVMALFFVGIPFLAQKGFIYCSRKIINFIITREPKDPIKILLIICSFIFLSIASIAYLTEKLNP